MEITEFDEMADRLHWTMVEPVRSLSAAIDLARFLLPRDETQTSIDNFGEAIFCRAEIMRR